MDANIYSLIENSDRKSTLDANNQSPELQTSN